MARQPDPAVESAWRKRMVRFFRWGCSVSDFCVEEGVSTASFYSWRRRLAEQRRESAVQGQANKPRDREGAKDEGRPPAFLPVVLTAADAPVTIQLGVATIRFRSADHELLRMMVRELAAAARSGERSC